VRFFFYSSTEFLPDKASLERAALQEPLSVYGLH
jgi:hypothetical protein